MLQRVVPPMPTLEITTTARCVVDCTYCPQDKLAAAYKSTIHSLSYENVAHVVWQLPRNVRIDFSGFVEPWLNRDCTRMLEHALEKSFHVGVYTTLIGVVDPYGLTTLLEQYAAQVEVLCLHLPDTNGNMRGFHDNRQWRTALRVFQELRERGTLRRFEAMVMGDTADVLVADLTRFVGVDRAGSLTRGDIAGQPVEDPVCHTGPVSCSYTPFYDQNVMLPNGDVVLCCNDYGLKHPIGNLFRQQWHELDRGHILDRNLRPDGETICRSCSRAVAYEQRDGMQMWGAR